jgi:hypothetical protein
MRFNCVLLAWQVISSVHLYRDLFFQDLFYLYEQLTGRYIILVAPGSNSKIIIGHEACMLITGHGQHGVPH